MERVRPYRSHPWVVAVFIGAPVALLLALAALDAYLARVYGTEYTFSAQMTDIGFKHPIVVAVVSYFAGALTWGLVCHFWAGDPRPDAIEREREKERTIERQSGRIAELEAILKSFGVDIQRSRG